MVRWAKTLVALVLLPACLGFGQAIIRIAQASESAITFWVAFIAGVACWLVIYLLLPKPMWIYVVGHEITHVLWAWLFGGKLKRFRATAKGGHVLVTRSNFLVALAPYFFPLYSTITVGVYVLGNWIWDWTPVRVWFHLFLGMAYAFHMTLTWHVLKSKQSDIVDQGYLFSAVVIWLGNASMLVVGIPLLTGTVSVGTAFAWCWQETESIMHHLFVASRLMG